jgi:Cu/Ag efflux protein CusF
MNKLLVKCAFIAGVFLGSTIGARAMDTAVPGARAGAEAANGRLRMAQAQQSEPQKIFRGVGVVTAIEPATGSLTINHEAIDGLMPAMEMMFKVDPRALSGGVRPGDEIEFGVDGKRYTIIDLKIVGHTE